MDAARYLRELYIFQGGTIWTKYAAANPSEARDLDAYLRSLATATPLPLPTPITKAGHLGNVLAAALASAPTPTPTPTPAPTATQWGIFGSYGNANLDPSDPGSPKANGINTLVMEITWNGQEPSNGSFADMSGLVSTFKQWRAWGYNVVLSVGVHHAPAWWFNLDPLTRFRSQMGETYTTASPGADGQDIPNFLNLDRVPAGQTLSLGGFIRRYVIHAVSQFAPYGIFAIRVGGGHFGELGFPNDYASNAWWAFDDGARAQMATLGLSGWTPGQASSNGEAHKFRLFVQGALNGWQNRQIQWCRDAGYNGPVAVLYPSYGANAAAMDAAEAVNFNGSTSPERNGEVQRGYWHDYLVQNVHDHAVNVLVWCTDVSGWSGHASDELAALADARGFRSAGENAGGSSGESLTSMQLSVAQAKKHNYATFCWIRWGDLAAGANGVHLSDYKATISA